MIIIHAMNSLPPLLRYLTKEVGHALAAFPVVILTGARQTGKSTLIRELLPVSGRDYPPLAVAGRYADCSLLSSLFVGKGSFTTSPIRHLSRVCPFSSLFVGKGSFTVTSPGVLVAFQSFSSLFVGKGSFTGHGQRVQHGNAAFQFPLRREGLFYCLAMWTFRSTKISVPSS